MDKIKELRIGIFKIVIFQDAPNRWFCKILIDNYCANTTSTYSTENNAISAAVKWVENTLAEATDAIKQPIFKPRCSVHAVRWFGEPLEGIIEHTIPCCGGTGIKKTYTYRNIRIKKGDWIITFNEQETIMSSEEFAELFVAGA